ncbi:isocitrate lyase/PEP mutase family protein [Roseococcus sp. YIM B11640]|uniref:isocitrate lyase/PEP mutase family protein n=1 Tax=Roseococcus sp. YIM B11640 TaxID=3133973 RepID=UPI003C7B1C7E
MRLGQAEAGRPGERLRALIAKHRPLIVPGCYNALSARILENAGFEAVYMSGYGTSLGMLGLPDAGLATLTEMASNAKAIASAVRVPVIADADTGHGNAINTIRCVEEFIRAGVAGIHLEDQVAPKRCGHVAGREVIGRAEAVAKVHAASETRKALDPSFVLIARTDARGAHGGSLEEAIWRANAFLNAGADLAFVEGPASVEEVRRITTEVQGPIFYNMTGISPRLSAEQMSDLGIRLCILPGALLRQSIMAMADLAAELRSEGPLAELRMDERFRRHALGNLHDFAGFGQIRALEARYLPAETQAKYESGLGHLPNAAAE